jgi:Holliday junction resolvase RusA-like endonuclease
MGSIELLIEGEPASKANSRRIVRRGNRIASIKSAKALNYSDTFRAQCPKDLVLLSGPVEIEITIYYASRRPDLDESLILDLLQGVAYENDRQVRAKHIYWRLDPERPRCRIVITPNESLDPPVSGGRRKGKGKAPARGNDVHLLP